MDTRHWNHTKEEEEAAAAKQQQPHRLDSDEKLIYEIANYLKVTFAYHAPSFQHLRILQVLVSVVQVFIHIAEAFVIVLQSRITFTEQFETLKIKKNNETKKEKRDGDKNENRKLLKIKNKIIMKTNKAHKRKSSNNWHAACRRVNDECAYRIRAVYTTNRTVDIAHTHTCRQQEGHILFVCARVQEFRFSSMVRFMRGAWACG